jgi:hypothetical protein
MKKMNLEQLAVGSFDTNAAAETRGIRPELLRLPDSLRRPVRVLAVG